MRDIVDVPPPKKERNSFIRSKLNAMSEEFPLWLTANGIDWPIIIEQEVEFKLRYR